MQTQVHERVGFAEFRWKLGPDGSVFAENDLAPLDRPMAQYFAFAGRKRHDAPWPAGTYSGRYSVIRDGKEIAFRDVRLEIRDAP